LFFGGKQRRWSKPTGAKEAPSKTECRRNLAAEKQKENLGAGGPGSINRPPLRGLEELPEPVIYFFSKDSTCSSYCFVVFSP
jgi:hypothetical protein